MKPPVKLAILGSIALLFFLVSGARGDAPRWTRGALDLARVCASEANWRTDVDDCPAIHSVISERARRLGLTWGRMVRLYSERVFDVERSDRRRWIAHLARDLRKPEGWKPSDGDWRSVRRESWRERLDEAQAIVDGKISDRCESTPFHWGGPEADRERIESGERKGTWHRISCGSTLNVFLAPGRASQAREPEGGSRTPPPASRRSQASERALRSARAQALPPGVSSHPGNSHT